MTISIVRQQSIAYDEKGLSSVHDDLYIKLEADLLDWLRHLDGAKFSAFMFIALQEAYVCANIGDPATIPSIVAGTPYGERAVRYAVKWLLQNEFITEGEPTANGAKTYRPKAFAWFGNHRRSAIFADPPLQPVADPANCRPLQRHDDDVLIDSISESLKTSSSFMEATRAFLARAQVKGKNLDRLAAKVAPALAEQWAEWVESKPRGFTNPGGYCFSQLDEDPQAKPPFFKKEEKALTMGEHMKLQRETHNTLMHRVWYESHGGCAECGIEPVDNREES